MNPTHGNVFTITHSSHGTDGRVVKGDPVEYAVLTTPEFFNPWLQPPVPVQPVDVAPPSPSLPKQVEAVPGASEALPEPLPARFIAVDQLPD